MTEQIDTDLNPSEISSVDDLPDDEQVDTGPVMSPSDIREAEFLAEIAPRNWLHSDGHEITIRECPQALERVARAQARVLQGG